MAVNRLLYSTQTCLITVGGAMTSSTPSVWAENTYQGVKDSQNAKGIKKNSTGFDSGVAAFLLPVQSVSVDETIPQDDVLVLGALGGVNRVQKDVATSKCTVKAYLADSMTWQDDAVIRDAGILAWTGDISVGAQQTGFTLREGDGTYGDVDATATDPTPSTLQQGAAGLAGPWPGITAKGSLAGESWAQNGSTAYTQQGLLEQLIFEAIGGYEARIEMFNPDSAATPDKDGFSFFGICSSIAIDASKGAYPTLDLNFEGVGQVEYLNMSHKSAGGYDLAITAYGGGQDSGNWYIHNCHPHTSDDVLIWGREQTFDTDSSSTYSPQGSAGSISQDQLILIASNHASFYQDLGVSAGTGHSATDRYNTAPANIDAAVIGNEGSADTLSAAKFSFDMPTETLSAIGSQIIGITSQVRGGNATFSKPPFKASMTLDGQGLVMAGHETDDGGTIVSGAYTVNPQIEERILPNEVQIGNLHAVMDPVASGVTTRSFSQNVGDVGATYNVAVEGTAASFYATYQAAVHSTAAALAMRDIT